MSKNALTTYQFPTQMQWEYHQLMNSKESFLKNLSSVEQRKLEALYAELTSAWHRNHTEILNQDLEMQYQELREIQQIIESDCSDFKKNTEQKLAASIQKKEQKLQMKKSKFALKKKNFEQTQLQQNLILEKKQQDLIKKQQTLKEKQEFLGLESRKKLQLLDEATEKVNEKQQLLTETLREQDIKSYNYKQTQTSYQNDLKNLQNLLDSDLKKIQTEKEQKLAEYKKLESNYQQDLNKKEESLKKDLLTYENNLILQLKQELLLEIPNCPEELKKYLIQEEHLEISKRESFLLKETNERLNALTKGLSKIGLDKRGIDAAKFMELMENHSSVVNS